MTRLITHQDLLTGTTIEANVKANLTDMHCENAQVIYVEKFLGTAQYEALLTEVSLSGLTGITGTTLSLYEKIKPMLVWYSLYMAIPWLPARISEKGINTMTSDNTKEASEKRITQLQTEAFNVAQEYHQKALIFLRNNYLDYPLWREDIYYSQPNVHASKSTYFSGIQFDRSPDWYNEKVFGYRRGDLL